MSGDVTSERIAVLRSFAISGQREAPLGMLVKPDTLLALCDEIDRLRGAIRDYLAVDDDLAPMDCTDDGYTCMTNEDASRQELAIMALRDALGDDR